MQSSPHPVRKQISAVVPARNEEENIEAAVRSLAAQAEIAEIIVVDDQSTDRTGEILARLAREVPRLRILDGGRLPAGWIGKNHALWIGAQATGCDWMLFTDADTVLLPHAARQAIEDAQQYDAALVSYSPRQLTKTIPERALIPFIYCRLSRKFNFAEVNHPSSPEAAANGQFILIRRDAYGDSGGHRAVAGTVLEDVALARQVKRAGFRLHFARGEAVARTRMYRSFAAMWQGWTKNLHALLGGTLPDDARELARTFPWLFVILVVSGICVRGRTGRWLLAAAGVALVLGHLWYARELRANRYSRRFIIYYGLAVSLYAAVIVASTWKYRRGKIKWKGREYPASDDA